MPTHVVHFLDDRHPFAELGSLHRGALSSGTAPDTDEIVFFLHYDETDSKNDYYVIDHRLQTLSPRARPGVGQGF